MVIAFHGWRSSGRKLQYAMSWPSWVDWYPDWQHDFRDATQFSQDTLAAYGRQKYVLVGYSLGGEFLAALTHEAIGEYLAGVIVYESPLRNGPPRKLDIPGVQIWNNYPQKGIRRKLQKMVSIDRWKEAMSESELKLGVLNRHIKRLPDSAPFRVKACEGWDASLNRWLGEWVGGRIANNLL